MAARKKSSMERVGTGIYRRPSGKYVVPIWDPVRRKRVFTGPGVPRGGFDTLREARGFKRDQEGAKDRLVPVSETADGFARRWPRDYPRPSAATNRHHRERLKPFVGDFEGRPLTSIGRAEARLWVHGGVAPPQLAKVAAGWKGAEVRGGEVSVPDHRGAYKQVRAMFNDAVNDELVAKNPFAALKVAEGNGRSQIMVLTERELGALADAADAWGDWGHNMIAPLILFAAGTGMRPGELFALRHSAVDLEADEVRVAAQYQSVSKEEKAPKRESYRTIALLPFVRAAYQRVPRQAGDDHVFYLQRGQQFNQRAFHYYWDPVRKAFWNSLSPERRDDIDPGFDFYELRHYFGTYLANLGMSPYDIADQMGHKDGGTLAMKTYIHVRSEDARDRIKAAVRAAQMPGAETA